MSWRGGMDCLRRALQVTVANTRGGCALELRDGRRLQIEDGTDPRWVAALAAALEGGAPC